MQMTASSVARRSAKKGSFLEAWLSHCSSGETPLLYDFFTGLWLLSLACGRNCVIDRPRAPVFLNQYLVLVAESGVTRKSTSVREAKGVAQAFLNRTGQKWTTIETRASVPSIEEKMALEGKAMFVVSELVTLAGKTMALELPAFLTDIYDCPKERRSTGTIERGEVVMSDVFPMFLSASTPTWLMQAVNPALIAGGFTSRCYFLIAEKRKRCVAWGKEGGSIDKLVDMLEHVWGRALSYGDIALTEAAIKKFKRWYNSRTESLDDYRRSFESREDAHVLRFAALLAANDGTWRIQPSHIHHAIILAETLKEHGASLFAPVTKNMRLIRAIEHVRQLLIAAGEFGLAQTAIQRSVHRKLGREEVHFLMTIMHEMRLVQKFTVPVRKGKAKTVWRALPALQEQNAMATMLERFS